MTKKVLVSSCLIGKKCSYDGEARTSFCLEKLSDKYKLIDICPEMAGGLGCPRDKHEIKGGTGLDVLQGKAKVLTPTGKDDTDFFIKGAEEALSLAKKENIHTAIMKARSPSCGSNSIYSGKFDGSLRPGDGVTASLLKQNDIKVFTEEEIEEVL